MQSYRLNRTVQAVRITLVEHPLTTDENWSLGFWKLSWKDNIALGTETFSADDPLFAGHIPAVGDYLVFEHGRRYFMSAQEFDLAQVRFSENLRTRFMRSLAYASDPGCAGGVSAGPLTKDAILYEVVSGGTRYHVLVKQVDRRNFDLSLFSDHDRNEILMNYHLADEACKDAPDRSDA